MPVQQPTHSHNGWTYKRGPVTRLRLRRLSSGESPRLAAHTGQSVRCCRPLGSDDRELALCRSRAVRLDLIPSARVMRVAVVPPSPVVPVITIVSDSPRPGHEPPVTAVRAISFDRSSTTRAGSVETRLHRALLRRDVSSEGRTLSKAL
jgi:hypothetical protein